MDISPPQSQMITEAISSLKEKSGSSQHAITKFIEEKYYGGVLPPECKKLLSKRLNDLAKSGALVKVKRSFKLPVKEKSKINSVEIKDEKAKTVKGKEAVTEDKTEGEDGMMGIGWIGKYAEKIKRLSDEMIPRISKEKLIQKQTANLEEWKKVAGFDLSLVESLEKVMQVQYELDKVKEQTVAKIQSLEDNDEEKQWRWQQQHNDDPVLKRLYEDRSTIIGQIPHFWSTAFMYDSGLRGRMKGDDEKIIKYLSSVVVEGRPDVTSKCTITFYFTPNPFFENSSLAKAFDFSSEGIIGARGTPITWKTDRGIQVGQPLTDMNKSFFEWFQDTEKPHDKVVANSIAHNLWCYAPYYFTRQSQGAMTG